MDWSSLLILVCPLMMIFMMFGMKGHGHGPHSRNSAPDKAIQTQLDELKAQNEQLRQELQGLTK
ncbi:DUF2933 domain-containing protein [Paenibacillus sp. NFR01]|uniref:DUF2933 domain-containing protein n=1 Tax=Paenibacillus sp. NFR01 TaxID=1566279 RepID=UPI0008BF06FA|nr:DUF2933 domain-containing protein [Paenibacillus sp. NFR01]SET22009.1 Protein of unknown function [Paenibacillus sp. NFR01]